jgi:hypothetical protein
VIQVNVKLVSGLGSIQTPITLKLDEFSSEAEAHTLALSRAIRQTNKDFPEWFTKWNCDPNATYKVEIVDEL